MKSKLPAPKVQIVGLSDIIEGQAKSFAAEFGATNRIPVLDKKRQG